MIVTDQAEVLAFLGNAAAYGEGVSSVQRIDTHASSVFLAGDRAFKLKRAVRYDYLDYSTPELRRAACEAELRLNRRTASAIYLDVSAITRAPDGTLRLGGDGAAVDWVVVMRRFAQERLLDRLAADGRLEAVLMVEVADAVAAFHDAAEVRRDAGDSAAVRTVIEGNIAALEEAGVRIDGRQVVRLADLWRAGLERGATLIEERRRHGRVRQCHGDLHLRNIVLLDEGPTLFDAIEFNDAFACIDVLYDIAFLVMDLLSRNLAAHACLALSRYLARTDDYDGLPLMPLFLSCRAAIRAKTSLSAAELQEREDVRQGLYDRAARYLMLAARMVAPAAPRLVAIGGRSGSGKSTLAERLAPTLGVAPGAIVLRSDVVRKLLAGVAPEASLPESSYERDVNRRVYAELGARARRAVQGGYSVILDAAFLERAERDAIEGLATAIGVPFAGLWLEADPDVLERRVAGRRRGASDATVGVLRQQLQTEPGWLTWARVDASSDEADTEARAIRALRRTVV